MTTYDPVCSGCLQIDGVLNYVRMANNAVWQSYIVRQDILFLWGYRNTGHSQTVPTCVGPFWMKLP